MPYHSLYRKYRSQTFGDLVGQDHVVRTLQNGIASGRIAHAYLFTGPRGTGKTSSARLLAKALCCEHGPTPEPDNTCEICLSITEGSCVDVVEMDAASESGVEDVRAGILENAEYRPMVARYKVFIIDEVHDLSSKAFDALLKTIEEPPDHVVFVLATTEYSKVPPTIRSRCQKHEFHRASMGDLVARLAHVAEQEDVQAEPQALAAIARMADGGYRDGLTLLEQAMLVNDGKVTLQGVIDQLGMVPEEAVDGLLLAMKEADVPGLMELLAEIARLGRDPRSILESMLFRLQDLTRAAYKLETGPTSDGAREGALHETAARMGPETILRLRGDLAEAHKAIRDITLPRLWLESELIRLSLAPGAAPALARRPETSSEAVAARSPTPPPQRPAREAQDPATPPMPDAPRVPEDVPLVPAAQQAQPLEAVEEPSGDSVLDHARQLWRCVLTELPAETNIARKLAGSTVASVAEREITVNVLRQIDYDWLMESPKRTGHIQNGILPKLAGDDSWSVRYAVGRRPMAADGPTTVELPAEGDRLEQLAREVFGA